MLESLLHICYRFFPKNKHSFLLPHKKSPKEKKKSFQCSIHQGCKKATSLECMGDFYAPQDWILIAL